MKSVTSVLLFVAILSLAFNSFGSSPYPAATPEMFKITSAADSGPGTLRQALEYVTRPDSDSFKYTNRWEFEGTIADNAIRNEYVGLSVGKGSQNPVRYRNI